MKRGFLKHIIEAHAVSLLIFGTGCTSIRHMTPSGRPEVTITHKTGEQVAARLTNEMINAGYNVKSATKTLIVFEKMVDNVLIRAMLGSRYDSNPALRIAYTIVETKFTTRVVASLSIITNPGSAFERVRAWNNSKDSQIIQRGLIRLGLLFEDPPEPGGRTPKIETREPVAAVEREPELEPPAHTGSVWSRLRRGLTEGDVLAILGEPSERSVSPKSTIWFYPDINSGYVLFKGNRVHSWQAP